MNNRPTLSLHAQSVKLDFGSALIEMDIEAFKNMIADLVMDAAAQGINFSIKEK
jgi:hypothetical protein